MAKYISVISDTHGAISNLRRLVGDFTVSDKIVFLGDGISDLYELYEFQDKIIKVAGNCDFLSSVPKREIFTVGGVKFLAVHGDEFKVKLSLQMLKEYAKKIGVDVVLYGHTHVSNIIEEDGITFINPGTLSRHGLKETFAFISVDSGKINAKIIPISRR